MTVVDGHFDGATDREAAQLWLAALHCRPRTDHDRVHVHFRLTTGGTGQLKHPARRAVAITESLLALGAVTDVYVGALARTRRPDGSQVLEHGWTLWAECRTAEATAALRTLAVPPSIVVRAGDVRQALWPLREQLALGEITKANRALARALGANANAGHPARFLRLPGTLCHDDDAPRRVHLETFTIARAPTRAEVLDGLLEPARTAS